MSFPIRLTALKHSICCLEVEVTFTVSANICCLKIHKLGNKTSNVHCPVVYLSGQEDLASSFSSQAGLEGIFGYHLPHQWSRNPSHIFVCLLNVYIPPCELKDDV